MRRDPAPRVASRHREGGRVVVWLLVAVLLVAAGGVGAWYAGALDRFLCEGGRCSATDVAPPSGLDLPQARDADPVLEPAQGPGLDRAKVEAAVAGLLDARSLGPHVGFAVRDLSSEQDVYSYAEGAPPLVPASTLKLFTSAAALASVGPSTRFATTVRQVDAPSASASASPSATPAPTAPAQLVLVGGGDPLLVTRPETGAAAPYPRGRATLRDLARRTVAQLRDQGVTQVSLTFDDTLFTGPGDSPDWEPQYVAGDLATTVSALWTDEGLLGDDGRRSRDPALDASRTFARLLGQQGITVTGEPARRQAPTGSTEVAAVQGPTVEQIVQHTLESSDNEAAEVLLRQVAVAEGRPATFEGGAAAVRAVLTGLGVPWDGNTVVDGSGLSRDNRVTAASMLTLLGLAGAAPTATEDPQLEAMRGVVSGLPVAGFSGSLGNRFTASSTDAGLGLVRAKTGTLTGVHALAGVTVDADGTPMAFVAMVDQVAVPQTLAARAQLDRITSALTACACSAAAAEPAP
ncbi:D-alanyl-D-alanine carboxypeptidase/D-alanyl-D-alanine endopeptidase [Solicola sp. PLA-1-18]|uniref:D-alanyl-D-alanine carboxypeptidase/D-alanyl-D-alanine endopeptidase n=1 Tax=Solicola sp. PLA-1-18 TaxID=3380532 RepID=UPI003B7E2497